MTAGVSVRVEGVAELRRNFDALTAKVDDAAGAGGLAVARPLAEQVRSRVPVRSGTLRATVAEREERDGAVVSLGDSSTPYANWIEYGGSRGRSYVEGGRSLGPATQATEPRAAGLMDKVISPIVKRYSW